MKQGRDWCGGNTWLWQALGAWETHLGRQELEKGPNPQAWQYHPQLQRDGSL